MGAEERKVIQATIAVFVVDLRALAGRVPDMAIGTWLAGGTDKRQARGP